MGKIIGRWIYGDRSYYLAHILMGVIVVSAICALLHFLLKQPLNIVLRLISIDVVELSATLLGFQLAGVSILISLDGNRKLTLLEEIDSDTMLYKVFISSITMFLFSIILMLASLNLFSELGIEFEKYKLIIDYSSVATFVFGIVFLLSSIQLLKWICSKPK